MCIVNDAIRDMRNTLAGAERRDPEAVSALLKATAAIDLAAAVRLVLPEIRQSLSAGDGRFTMSQVESLEKALAFSRGERSLAAAA